MKKQINYKNILKKTDKFIKIKYVWKLKQKIGERYV